MAATVKVKQIRSGIGFERNQKETLRSMGLRKLNQVVELPDNPAVRGMIYTVRHLVEVVEGARTPSRPSESMVRDGSE